MRKILLTNVIVLIVLLALSGGIYYYFWEKATFITTDDAQVTGRLVTITPQIPGKLTKWDLHPGDKVSANQVVAVQDNGYAIAQYMQTHPQDKNIPQAVKDEGNIASPISGTIIQTSPVAADQTVVPGEPLATVVDFSHLTVVANIEETNLQDVKVGQSVDIYVDSQSGSKFSGTITKIGSVTAGELSLLPSGNPSGNFTKVVQRIPVTISFSDMPTELKPGMSATVKIHR